jgi:hypothetical protein
VLTLALLTAAVAGVCPDEYSVDLLGDDLAEARMAAREDDPARFDAAAGRMELGLPCLADATRPQILATAYRLVGAKAVLDGRQDQARLWFRIALEIEPAFQWDVAEFSAEGPEAQVLNLFERERGVDSDAVPIPGRSLALDSGSRLLVDGAEAKAAAATLDRYHLLQLVDTDGMIRSAWLIQGNAFPTRLLGDAMISEAGDVEKKGGGSGAVYGYSEDDVVLIDANSSPLKMPLLLSGAVTLAAAGTFYGLSFPASSAFEEATTEDGLYTARGQANTRYLLAISLGLAGAGLATGGLLVSGGPLDGGGQLGLGLRW